MYTVSYTYRVCKGDAPYTCPCSSCGKTLKRKYVAEHTVNPFNKNDDGSVKTESQVFSAAYREAESKASELQGVPVVCRTCENLPYYDELVNLLTSIEEIFSDRPSGTPGSRLLSQLQEWQYVQPEWARDEAAFSGWSLLGYKLTKKAREWGRKKGVVASVSA